MPTKMMIRASRAHALLFVLFQVRQIIPVSFCPCRDRAYTRAIAAIDKIGIPREHLRCT